MKDTVKVMAMLNEKGAKPSSFEGSSSFGQFFLSELKKKSMLIALIVVVIYFGFSTKGVMLLPRNVSNLIFQNAYIAILAVGMLLCILTGGNIDLSVGSSVCLVGAIAGEMMIVRKLPVLPSILVCLALGLLLGIWQGFWIAYVGIPPFIATLAGQLIFRGLSLRVLKGLTLSPFPDSFQNLFVGHVQDYFKMPNVAQRISFICLGIVALAILIFLTLTYRGKISKIKKGNPIVVKIIYYAVAALLAAAIVFGVYILATRSGLTKFFVAPKTILNITCIVFGSAAALVFLVLKIIGRVRKIKKGYAAGNAIIFYSSTVIMVAIIVFFSFWLARYKGLPTVMVTLIFVVLVYSILTSMTVPGRFLYALGGNPKAARMSGIDTKKVMFFAYANMSFLAAVAGLVFAARLNSANPTAGQNFELDAIASCFIGGASAYGGIGTVGGVLIGAAFMGIMNNGMNFMGFLTSDQMIVKGLVLLLAVAFDVISKRKSR